MNLEHFLEQIKFLSSKGTINEDSRRDLEGVLVKI